jgi:hypothetical protein
MSRSAPKNTFESDGAESKLNAMVDNHISTTITSGGKTYGHIPFFI